MNTAPAVGYLYNTIARTSFIMYAVPTVSRDTKSHV